MKRVNIRSIALLVVMAFLFSISSAISVSVSAATSKTFYGYLTDAHCGKSGIDDLTGKINLKKNPEKHTTACIKLEMCKEEGFGMMLKQSNGTYKYYKFNSAGATKAKALLKTTKRKFGHKITVVGKVNGTTISVTSIKEKK